MSEVVDIVFLYCFGENIGTSLKAPPAWIRYFYRPTPNVPQFLEKILQKVFTREKKCVILAWIYVFCERTKV